MWNCVLTTSIDQIAKTYDVIDECTILVNIIWIWTFYHAIRNFYFVKILLPKINGILSWSFTLLRLRSFQNTPCKRGALLQYQSFPSMQNANRKKSLSFKLLNVKNWMHSVFSTKNHFELNNLRKYIMFCDMMGLAELGILKVAKLKITNKCVAMVIKKQLPPWYYG